MDYFARLIGLPDLKFRAVKVISLKEHSVLEAYLDGINAFLRLRGDDLRLYFHIFQGLYSVQDVILDRPDSRLWDGRV